MDFSAELDMLCFPRHSLQEFEEETAKETRRPVHEVLCWMGDGEEGGRRECVYLRGVVGAVGSGVWELDFTGCECCRGFGELERVVAGLEFGFLGEVKGKR